MNDYQMSFLANDHHNALQAEAAQQRLARTARPASARSHSRSVKPRRTRRLSLQFLFDRASA